MKEGFCAIRIVYKLADKSACEFGDLCCQTCKERLGCKLSCIAYRFYKCPYYLKKSQVKVFTLRALLEIDRGNFKKFKKKLIREGEDGR